MRALSLLGLTVLMVLPSRAALAFDCAGLPNPIYVSGVRSAFLSSLGQKLDGSSTTLVFKGGDACSGLSALLPSGSGGTPMLGAANYWDSSGVEQACDLPVAGVTADLAITARSTGTCATALQLPGSTILKEVLGPSVPYMFVTPLGGGSPSAISAEQAYYVFGYGAAGAIVPWDDPNQAAFSFLFASTDPTLAVLAGAIGVSPSSAFGTIVNGSSNMVTALVGSAQPLLTIGMLSADVVDPIRGELNALAFRGYGQDFAWLPDANGGYDKRNVREGRYVLFAPLHFAAVTSGEGQQVTPGAQTLLAIADGTTALPIDIVQLVTKAHLVPQCALRFERTQDAFDPSSHYGLAPSNRTQSCDCYFDSLTGATTCASCSGNSCPGSAVCRHNFCEAF